MSTFCREFDKESFDKKSFFSMPENRGERCKIPRGSFIMKHPLYQLRTHYHMKTILTKLLSEKAL